MIWKESLIDNKEGVFIKINWKVRLKNPVFYVQLLLSIMTPVLTYMGITVKELTSWGILGEVILSAIKNPYVIMSTAVSVWNAITDPTTSGMGDSTRALKYTEPK